MHILVKFILKRLKVGLDLKVYIFSTQCKCQDIIERQFKKNKTWLGLKSNTAFILVLWLWEHCLNKTYLITFMKWGSCERRFNKFHIIINIKYLLLCLISIQECSKVLAVIIITNQKRFYSTIYSIQKKYIKESTMIHSLNLRW